MNMIKTLARMIRSFAFVSKPSDYPGITRHDDVALVAIEVGIGRQHTDKEIADMVRATLAADGWELGDVAKIDQTSIDRTNQAPMLDDKRECHGEHEPTTYDNARADQPLVDAYLAELERDWKGADLPNNGYFHSEE